MEQLSSLRANFQGDHWVTKPNGFIWWFTVTPTAISDTYTLRIEYSENQRPEVFVRSPKPLKMPKGAKRLPHTYDSKRQSLCLYIPGYREWTSSKLISKTLLHWALEWLVYYEEWAYSGIWLGGGHGTWDAIPEE